MSTKVLLILLPLIVLCHGFNKEEFLNKYCEKVDHYYASFRFGIEEECLLCKDVKLSTSDAEVFENENLDLTNVENVIFEGGNVGIVNSDFFKQFPHTKLILFSNVSLDLAPSDTLEVNPKIETVGIIKSTVARNQKTNALHSLSELKIFVITGCYLEHTTIDGDLLRMNKELIDITVSESGIHPPEDHPSLLKHINEDAFDHLDKVERLYLSVEAMSHAYSKWYQDKPIKDALINGGFEEFPKNIPDSVEELDVYFSKIKHLGRDDLKHLKKLTRFSMCHGELETVDEDTFDDLEKLEYLFLSTNNINKFSARHLKNLKHIILFGIGNNSLDDLSFLEELDLVPSEKDKKGVYTKKDAISNNIE